VANQGSRGDGGKEPEAWLLDGEDGFLVAPPTLTRIRSKARNAIGRPDLRLHDLRHSGLTWAAATGAILAEVMRRAGHESPTAALRYQRATEDRNKALVDALAGMALHAGVILLPKPKKSAADNPRTTESGHDGADATITPLTTDNTGQSQRGSNPCLHLERANRFMASGPGRSHVVAFLHLRTATFDDRRHQLGRLGTPWNGVVG
jgi:hypothetical protein